MGVHWQTVKLAEAIEINPKKMLPKGTLAKKISMDKLQPFCRDIPEYEMAEFFGGTKFKNGDTIMARITPCLENGKTAMVNILQDDEVGFGSTEFIVFRAKPGVTDPDYVYYLVSSPAVREPAIKSMVGSSGRQRVQTDVVKGLEISLPSLSDQQRIAGVLKALDDKIALSIKINNNLFEQAKLLYKSRFVDFITSDGIMPLDWRKGTVSEIIEIHDSKRIPLSSREREKLDKVYPYYGATSIMDYVDKYIFDGIYLLLGEDGTVVDSAGFPVLQYVEGKFWVNNHAHILTGKNGYNVELLYLLFSLTNVAHIVTGAVQPKISQANLNNIEIIIPTKDELASLNNIIQPMFAEIRNRRAENERLASLRDTILPRLMSGQIDISNIEF